MSMVDMVVGPADAALLAIGGAGVAVIGVLFAGKAIHWIQCVIINREASAEYYDRYGR